VSRRLGGINRRPGALLYPDSLAAVSGQWPQRADLRLSHRHAPAAAVGDGGLFPQSGAAHCAAAGAALVAAPGADSGGVTPGGMADVPAGGQPVPAVSAASFASPQ